MAFSNSELSKNLHSPEAHIWNHMLSFIRSMTLKCAVQLEIPDIINRHGSPMLLSELVEALPIKVERTQFVYRLMRILVQSGFFTKQSVSTTRGDNEDGEGYMLTPSSRLLLKEDPLSVRPFLLTMLDPSFMDLWQHTSTWFQNDDANLFQTAHGRTIWDMTSEVPRLNELVNQATASDSEFVMNAVLEQSIDVFHGLHSVVDVAGGTGVVSKAIAKAFPDISCVCFDLPHVVDGLVGSKNMTYVGGDMFESVPSANAVLLKWIMHDWNDEDCKKILKNCKDSIPTKENGGKLLIIDMVLKDDQGANELFETQLFLDMIVMACYAGKERTEKEWAKLFLDGGFSSYKITSISGLRSLIEVYP